MDDRSNTCPVCGASSSRGSVLELDLGDDAFDVALDRVPRAVARRRPGRGRRRSLLIAAPVLALVGAVAALSDGGPRPASVLPSKVTAAPTATTAAATTDAPAAVAAGPMLGEATGLSLVVLDAPDLVRIDLDTGRAERLDTDLAARSAGGPTVATSRGLAFVDRDGGVSVLAPGTSTAQRLLAPAADERASAVLAEGPAATLWLVLDGPGGARVGSVDLDGPGVFVAAGAVPSGAVVRADGVGGAVVGAPGGVYRLRAGAPATRLTGGALVDAGAGRVLTTECDDTLACAWQVLDLADGSRWRVGVPASATGDVVRLTPAGRIVRVVPTADAGRARLEVLGPGGVRAAVDGVAACGVADGCRTTLAWSPDGRWLVGAAAGGGLWAWRDGDAVASALDPVVLDGQPLTVARIMALTTVGASTVPPA